MRNNAYRPVLDIQTWASKTASLPMFREGYESVLKNRSFDYSIEDTGEAYTYTRGRQFAVWCKVNKLPRAVWRNGQPASTLVERLVRAVYQRAVI